MHCVFGWITGKARRCGILEGMFGVFWFPGSRLLGVLYDRSIPAMIAVSVIAQLAAIALYLGSAGLKSRQE